MPPDSQTVTFFIEGLKFGTTTSLGGMVAAIAFLQWRTAREKVALDLFDRRFQMIEQATSAIKKFHDEIVETPTGRAEEVGAKNYMEFCRVTFSARYLFGTDVQMIVGDIANRMLSLGRTVRRERHGLSYEAEITAFKAKAEGLNAAVERYMSLGRVAVSKSKRRK